jgi:hypothetical protein
VPATVAEDVLPGDVRGLRGGEKANDARHVFGSPDPFQRRVVLDVSEVVRVRQPLPVQVGFE